MQRGVGPLMEKFKGGKNRKMWGLIFRIFVSERLLLLKARKTCAYRGCLCLSHSGCRKTKKSVLKRQNVDCSMSISCR